MRILNFGSLNIDHVYNLDHFVGPGETLNSTSYEVFPGGKGANQSIALALAGAKVVHAGKIGNDGLWYRNQLKNIGVDVTHIEVVSAASGHAIIQVNKHAENAIILFGGANMMVTSADADRVISSFSLGDFLLLQNEISAIPSILERAELQGMHIVFNPAPMNADVISYPLHLVDTFILNEIEAEQLTGHNSPHKILDVMLDKYKSSAVVLTLGSKGVIYGKGKERLSVPALQVKAVDTTAAGDTFIGYFLAELAAGCDVKTALETGCIAAAICVTRKGAASSIPTKSEVTAWKEMTSQLSTTKENSNKSQ